MTNALITFWSLMILSNIKMTSDDTPAAIMYFFMAITTAVLMVVLKYYEKKRDEAIDELIQTITSSGLSPEYQIHCLIHSLNMLKERK